jgi:hypothetical protein
VTQDKTVYPDTSDIFALKDEGRREIRRRSFGEKIAMVEKLRERLAPLKRLRYGKGGASLIESLGDQKSPRMAED